MVGPACINKMVVPMHRAYSLLAVKSVSEDERVIRGTATTPSPDRVGDIVEPLGVQFTNPMPLLWQHRSDAPVGLVKFDKPTSEGITFEAKLPRIEEEGALKARVDEAWQSVKAGLVRAVSIGFRALESSVMKDGGVRFLESEILELSLVTIPANADATITSIRSIDTALLAASGRGQTDDRRDHPPGVSGTPKHVPKGRWKMSKTVAEQISAFEATRQAKASRMTDIMEKSAETGETLDAAQTEEYDGLKTEVKSIDDHLVRLADLEKLNASKAKPVAGVDTIDRGSAVRGGQVVTAMKDNLPPGIEFARYAMCLASAKGNTSQALEIAKARYPEQQRIQNVLKAAVAGGTTTDATWAGALVDYAPFAGDFVEYLRPMTILGKFGTNGIPSLRRVPFNITIPSQTSGGDAYWVGEGAPKPLTKFDYAQITLRWAKVANIAVLTEELVRFSNPSAEALVRDSLRDAIVARLDTDFVDPQKAEVSNVSPASIINGISPIVSSGTDADGVREDVRAIMAAFIASNLTPSTGVWIMNANTALSVSLMQNALGQTEFPGINMNGGTFFGIPVIVSQYVPSGIVILVNASDIYLADDGQVVIDASREASLQMLDNPTNNSSTGTATTMVSMFQTNSIALRAERFINWKRRRSAAVQWLEDVDWNTATGSDA